MINTLWIIPPPPPPPGRELSLVSHTNGFAGKSKETCDELNVGADIASRVGKGGK